MNSGVQSGAKLIKLGQTIKFFLFHIGIELNRLRHAYDGVLLIIVVAYALGNLSFFYV